MFYILSFQPEGEDELKRKQLMELAIINGTYRSATEQAAAAAAQLAAKQPSGLHAALRKSTIVPHCYQPTLVQKLLLSHKLVVSC